MGNYAAQGLPLPFVKKSLQQVRTQLGRGEGTTGLLAGGHAIVLILGSSATNPMTASAKKGAMQGECPRHVGVFLRKTVTIYFGCKERKC